MKRVLITGASGFIGSHCLEQLQKTAYQLHATEWDPMIRHRFDKVTWHRVDLLKGDQVEEMIRNVRPTHLLHLAWHVETGMQLNSTENLKWINASINLLEAFQKNGGRRIVVSGSCAEYDWKHAFLSERSTPLLSGSLYGSSKHALQSILDAYCRETGLSYAWGRLFFTYGPGENSNRLVASVICSLLSKKEKLCSHGNQVRDYLYVKDVADVLVSLLASPVEGPINIASGEPVQLKNIILRIADLIGETQHLIRLGGLPNPKNEPRAIVADVERLRRELDWRPSYELDVGLMETIAWWKQKMGI